MLGIFSRVSSAMFSGIFSGIFSWEPNPRFIFDNWGQVVGILDYLWQSPQLTPCRTIRQSRSMKFSHAMPSIHAHPSYTSRDLPHLWQRVFPISFTSSHHAILIPTTFSPLVKVYLNQGSAALYIQLLPVVNVTSRTWYPHKQSIMRLVFGYLE